MKILSLKARLLSLVSVIILIMFCLEILISMLWYQSRYQFALKNSVDLAEAIALLLRV